MLKKTFAFVMFMVLLGGLWYVMQQFKNEDLGRAPTISGQGTMTVKVFFNNTKLNFNTEDCGQVYPRERIVPRTLGVAKAVLQELFKGPTAEEKSQGYASWFSSATAEILKNVKVDKGTAYVNLQDIRQLIPNASSSCGSAELMAELETTLKQFPSIKKIIVAIDEQPGIFYEWIQIGCAENNNFCDATPFSRVNSSTEEELKKIISDKAQETLLAIKNKDAAALAKIVEPDKGVRFSSYANVNMKSNLIFSSDKITNFFQDNKVYNWGIYEGSGTPINFTPAEYYSKFIYDVDFFQAPNVSYNRIIGKGNIINNAVEVYPQAIIVEYNFSGFDPKYENMDWRSLRLVFEQKDEVWYLVGVIHDQWTI